ncbi:hypothetical protein TNCV_1234431 [Trichonephila clavipes]|nr:hypothetical protein TNCV_1234431 [Trichonephila clavipes]
MPLDNKCRIGPLAGAPRDTCAVVISTETESIHHVNDTSRSSTSSCRGRQKSSRHCYDVGSVAVSVLADVTPRPSSVSPSP